MIFWHSWMEQRVFPSSPLLSIFNLYLKCPELELTFKELTYSHILTIQAALNNIKKNTKTYLFLNIPKPTWNEKQSILERESNYTVSIWLEQYWLQWNGKMKWKWLLHCHVPATLKIKTCMESWKSVKKIIQLCKQNKNSTYFYEYIQAELTSKMKINMGWFFEQLGKLGIMSLPLPIEMTVPLSNCIADGNSIWRSLLTLTLLIHWNISGLCIFHLHIDLNTNNNTVISTTVWLFYILAQVLTHRLSVHIPKTR